MEGSPPVHVPTICPHSSLLEQAPGGKGDSNLDSPSVAQSDLVPTVTQELDRPSDPSPSNSEYCDQPRGLSTQWQWSPSSGRLACLKRSYRTEGLSDRVISIIRKSWRGSTESAYSSVWRQWDSWCFRRGIDPLSAPVRDVLEFLFEQFEMGKQYCTINTLRSAISMTHEVDGTRVGRHPLVSRFLKGASVQLSTTSSQILNNMGC